MSNETDADLPPRVAHSRRSLRQRTLQPGKITYREGAVTLDCTIRDFSETGARITVQNGQVIPTNVVLVYPRTQTAFEAQVAWIKAQQFGLKFVGTHQLTGDLPTHLKYLKSPR